MLLDPEVTTFEQDLLRSWLDEQPDAAARERAMALATVAGGVAVVGVSGALGPKAMSAMTLAIVKWLSIGAALTAVAVGGAAIVRPDRAPSPTSTLHVAKVPPSRDGALVREAPASTEAPTDGAKASSAAPLPRAPQPPPSTLSDEISAIDRARAAIAAGDGVRGLQLVDDYQRRFPRGMFTQEAEVLRVEALVVRGDRAGARRAVERFLAAHPASPHAPRLRAMAK
jgi:hypothetical protein